MKRMAHSIARMEVINPEVLRVTPAFQAFQQFGAALRPRQRGSFYHKSRESHKISTFWSHSWRGGHWRKLLTLVILLQWHCRCILGFPGESSGDAALFVWAAPWLRAPIWAFAGQMVMLVPLFRVYCHLFGDDLLATAD